jgi:phospholipid-binding lipoprotein MlaA
MLMRPERQRLVSVVATLLLATGCTTLPPNAGQDPRDPFEKVNRNVFAFNQGFDEAVLKPLAELWAKLPNPVLDCLSNAFFNLRGPSTAINNTLQGKPVEGLSDLGRFVVNDRQRGRVLRCGLPMGRGNSSWGLQTNARCLGLRGEPLLGFRSSVLRA